MKAKPRAWSLAAMKRTSRKPKRPIWVIQEVKWPTAVMTFRRFLLLAS